MKNLKLSLLFLITSLFVFSCGQSNIKTNPSDLKQILAKFHDPSSNKILITAHRAMHTKYPENSLAAFQHSINSGVDIIETDIRTTKDGKLVLMHDGSVDRTTNGEGKLKNFTFAELEKLELEKESDDPNTYRVPLAEDALNLAHGKIMVDLDIKSVYIKNLVDLVHKTQTEKQVLFFDSDFAVLDSVLLLDSTLMLMPRAHSLEEVKEIIKRYHPLVIHIDPSFYTKEVVSTIKASGARIWINALGFADAKAMIGLVDTGYASLVEGGANIIQTDYPLILHKYLTERNLR
ncbi:MAG: glycerophosphodiester phosphodiesterase family protein [Chlorobi bacterium]|nr:glycerophosphodiester phosphodiesterase family protein [Chlorobiota bacterium]